MNLIIYGIFIVYAIILIIRKADFIYYLPLFHVIVDISFFYLGPGSLATYYRGVIMLGFFYFISDRFRFIFPLRDIIIVFLVFTGLLTLQSTEFLYSVKGYSQVFFSVLMLPAGYLLIDSNSKLIRLNRQYIMIIYISVLMTAIGYIFNVGKNFNYGEDEQKIGLLGSAGLYSGAVCIALLPILIGSLRKSWMRIVTYGTAVVLFIFILLNVRRTAIMIPFVGVIAFLFTTKRKFTYLTYVLATVLVIAFASYWYGDKLTERLEFRQEAGRFDKDFYKTEGRYLEVLNISQEAFSFTDPMASIFGIGHNIFAEHIKNSSIVRRMYHTDYGRLLYGSGIIGIFLYLFFTFKLFFLADLGKRTGTINIMRLKSMIFALAVINLALMVNGSLNLITLKSVIFLYIGALLRIYHKSKVSINKNNSSGGSDLPVSQAVRG